MLSCTDRGCPKLAAPFIETPPPRCEIAPDLRDPSYNTPEHNARGFFHAQSTPELKGDPHGQKITIQKVADQYGVSTRTVRRYIAAGRLTAYRVGPRMIRLDADQVRQQLLGEPVGGVA